MITYSIGLKNKFRGITLREGMLFEGPAGWAEWSPFLDYDDATCVSWLRAAREAANDGWPAPVRDAVPVNCTVPAIDPARAAEIVRASGCGTAKVKVAEPGQTLADDLARVEAVRDALGPGGASLGPTRRRLFRGGVSGGPCAVAAAVAPPPARARRRGRHVDREGPPTR